MRRRAEERGATTNGFRRRRVAAHVRVLAGRGVQGMQRLRMGMVEGEGRGGGWIPTASGGGACSRVVGYAMGTGEWTFFRWGRDGRDGLVRVSGMWKEIKPFSLTRWWYDLVISCYSANC